MCSRSQQMLELYQLDLIFPVAHSRLIRCKEMKNYCKVDIEIVLKESRGDFSISNKMRSMKNLPWHERIKESKAHQRYSDMKDNHSRTILFDCLLQFLSTCLFHYLSHWVVRTFLIVTFMIKIYRVKWNEAVMVNWGRVRMQQANFRH